MWSLRFCAQPAPFRPGGISSSSNSSMYSSQWHARDGVGGEDSSFGEDSYSLNSSLSSVDGRHPRSHRGSSVYKEETEDALLAEFLRPVCVFPPTSMHAGVG